MVVDSFDYFHFQFLATLSHTQIIAAPPVSGPVSQRSNQSVVQSGVQSVSGPVSGPVIGPSQPAP